MAAKVYSVPEGYDEPSFDIAIEDGADAYFKACDDHTQRLAEWCRSEDITGNEWIGEVIDFPVADGKATYMILDTKPLALIHLNYVDGYHADPILMRGLRLTDVKKLVKQRRTLAELFGQSTTPKN